MTTHKEALRLALEALDQLTNAADTFSVSGVYFNEEVWAKKCLSDAYFAINAIEQTLAQPEQEPVAWITQGGKGWLRWHKSYDDNKDSVPLYTTPPQRPSRSDIKPLTEEQYFEIGQRHWLPSNKIEQIHKEIEEAAHGIKEKNT